MVTDMVAPTTQGGYDPDEDEMNFKKDANKKHDQERSFEGQIE
jgi:hypothetical protein